MRTASSNSFAVFATAGKWLLGLCATMVLLNLVRWGQAGFGIVPRTFDGLFGIATAPVLHSGWGHLLSNLAALIPLGLLVGAKGRFWSATAFVWVFSGIGVWVFGFNGSHMGASGLVFGYLGYLVFSGVAEKSALSLLLSGAVLMVWGVPMMMGLLPAPGISFTAHLFGFVGGALIAFVHGSGRNDKHDR